MAWHHVHGIRAMCTTTWPNAWDKGSEGDTWKSCVTTIRLNINLSGKEKQFGGRKEKKEKERKKKGRKKERKERKEKEKKEKKERTSRFSSNRRLFDGRNSSNRESKSVYATKATRGYWKQEVSAKLERGRDSSYFGSFSIIRVVGLCLCPKDLFGRISKYRNAVLF